MMQKRKRTSKHDNNDHDDDEGPRLKFKKKKEGYIKPQKIKGKDLKQPGFQFRQLFLSEMK